MFIRFLAGVLLVFLFAAVSMPLPVGQSVSLL